MAGQSFRARSARWGLGPWGGARVVGEEWRARGRWRGVVGRREGMVGWGERVLWWWWWIGGEGWFLVMGCESFVVRRSYLGKEEEVVSPFFC